MGFPPTLLSINPHAIYPSLCKVPNLISSLLPLSHTSHTPLTCVLCPLQFLETFSCIRVICSFRSLLEILFLHLFAEIISEFPYLSAQISPYKRGCPEHLTYIISYTHAHWHVLIPLFSFIFFSIPYITI